MFYTGKAALELNGKQASPIVIDHDDHQLHLLHLLERYLEGKAFVIVGIQRALLDRRFLLLHALAVHHEHDLHVRIAQAADVHFLQVLRLQDDHRQLAGRGHISKRETNIAQLVRGVFCRDQWLPLFDGLR